MFATLVVVLPSDYSGGELLVRHKGQEVRLDLRRDEPSEAAFAAFFADCVHEVLPVDSGHRLALIYNLIRVGEGPPPSAPDYESVQRQAIALLRLWDRGQGSLAGSEPESDQSQAKLIYPLEHAYTQAELDFSALKGADAAVAGVILESARETDCDLYLALDFETEQRGRPYTLRCTKNQASYDLRVEQRRQNLEHLRRLGGDGPGYSRPE